MDQDTCAGDGLGNPYLHRPLLHHQDSSFLFFIDRVSVTVLPSAEKIDLVAPLQYRAGCSRPASHFPLIS